MCNLYSLTKSRDAIVQLFKVPHNRAVAFEPLAAIYPAYAAPVIRPTSDGALEMVTMSWGFVLPQPGKAPRRVTNTRDDKVRSSTFWRDSFRSRRCLVPVTAFAEPHDGRKPATWHWFALTDETAENVGPRPLFAFAGLWRHWKGPVKKDGPVVEIETYSFMTTVPNELTAAINHERSPVILATEAARDTWLYGTADDAFALAKPYAAERMHEVPAEPAPIVMG